MVDQHHVSQTVEALRALHIVSKRDEDFAKHLESQLRREEGGGFLPEPMRYTSDRETRGIMVIDDPGGGKTRLVARGLRKSPALAEGPFGPRFIEISVPSPTTLKSVALALLQQTGYHVTSTRREVWSLWQQVRIRLRELGVVVLWIDEAHDLFCADRNLILRALKSLMQGDDAVIVVLSGTRRLNEIIRSDPQVQRRFSTLRLPAVEGNDNVSEFRVIIENFCDRTGLKPPNDPDLLDRLFHASRYRFGRVIETIIGAVEVAMQEGADTLDSGHFAEYWAMKEGCGAEGNVFVEPEWRRIDPDNPELDPLDTELDRKKRAGR